MSKKNPNVIFTNPDMVVASIKEKTGFLSSGGWEVRYGKRSHPTEKVMTISSGTQGGTAGGGFKVVWTQNKIEILVPQLIIKRINKLQIVIC